MIVHDVQQGSEAWKALRRGIPTASEFDALVTPEWKVRTGQTPETFLNKKLCERLLGYSSSELNAASYAMDQGTILENEARPWYEFTQGQKVQTVGFITTADGMAGCSPDGLIGDDSGLEVKCPQAETHIRYLLAGSVPKEYAAQVQGCMFVTQRPRWVFVSYSRVLRPMIVEVEADPTAQAAISDALAKFSSRFAEAVAKLSQFVPQQRGRD